MNGNLRFWNLVAMLLEKEMKWKCKLCGRIMDKKSPHNCISGFRKRHIIWEEYKPNQENKAK